MPRQVAAETLDHLAPDDPKAMRSRRDLVRVHRVMGTRAIVKRGWQGLVATRRGGLPLRILEIGAGDGRLLLGVARAMAPHWAPVRLTLLDRQDIVSPATLAGYADLGWAVEVHVADVLSWAGRPEEHELIAMQPRWNLITTTLFLHHFEGSTGTEQCEQTPQAQCPEGHGLLSGSTPHPRSQGRPHAGAHGER